MSGGPAAPVSGAATVVVVLNGAPAEVPAGSTVADLAHRLGLVPERGVAVEVDGVVAPRGRWHEWVLGAGARIEVVRMVGGGA